jgi:hypothetical protein
LTELGIRLTVIIDEATLCGALKSPVQIAPRVRSTKIETNSSQGQCATIFVLLGAADKRRDGLLRNAGRFVPEYSLIQTME